MGIPVFKPYISIHAPTRGATQLSLHISKQLLFQSTLPRGERQYRNGSGDSGREFQSTLPREERQLRLVFVSVQIHFNPRSHEGSDSIAGVRLSAMAISIHAPTRGATDSVECMALIIAISIHAPTRGATAIDFTMSRVKKISIHAPTRGATR